jgi:hypothetical protein
MTVCSEKKLKRREILAEHVIREHARTGRNAYEQWVDRVGTVSPIHRKINQRAEKARELIPWRPGDGDGGGKRP